MMEKSGCLQLTREEYSTLQSYLDFQGDQDLLTKAASVVQRFQDQGLTLVEVASMLDAGEYRIVED